MHKTINDLIQDGIPIYKDGEEMKPTEPKVVIIDGPSAISGTVAKAITNMGYEIVVIGCGQDSVDPDFVWSKDVESNFISAMDEVRNIREPSSNLYELVAASMNKSRCATELDAMRALFEIEPKRPRYADHFEIGSNSAMDQHKRNGGEPWKGKGKRKMRKSR